MANATLTIWDHCGNLLFNDSISFGQGVNIQQFMEGAVNQVANIQTLSFGAQYYGAFQQSPVGYLLNMVNGTYDAPTSGLYWEFIYNGVVAPTGMEKIYPVDGSTITFKQSTYSTSSSPQIGIKHAFHNGGENNLDEKNMSDSSDIVDDPVMMTVTVRNSANAGCQVEARWDGGRSQQVSVSGDFGNPGAQPEVRLSFSGPPVGTSCWMSTAGGHESGDNFNFGDQNIQYQLYDASVTGSWGWNRTS